MNTDILPVNTSKCEKLKESSNVQICKHDNSKNPQIRNVPDKALENLNQSTDQKQKPNSLSNSAQTSHTLPTSTKNIYSTAAGKHQKHKLVDSKQVSRPFYQSDKKTFLLDTYARIVATNNRRCSKRLHELAKPKKLIRNDQNGSPANLDVNYWHMNKTYAVKTKTNP